MDHITESLSENEVQKGSVKISNHPKKQLKTRFQTIEAEKRQICGQRIEKLSLQRSIEN